MFDFDCRIVLKLYIKRDKIGGQKKYIIVLRFDIARGNCIVLYSRSIYK